MTDKEVKTIDLGYIALEGWEYSDGLIQNWMKERGEIEPDHNEIVLEPSTDYVLKITYPLSKAYLAPGRTPSTGVSRIDLVTLIVEAYKEIYSMEEFYGIWGHCLGDLMLHTAHVDEDGVITVGVDS